MNNKRFGLVVVVICLAFQLFSCGENVSEKDVTYTTLQSGVIDTDGDGLSDTQETDIFLTDPFRRDTDGDGLVDGLEEVFVYGTDPLLADTDGDGLDDGLEVSMENCLDPLVGDSMADPDGDGLTNMDELTAVTDPCDPDTDNDGLSDGQEGNTLGTDPVLADTDGDGLNDGYEINYPPTEFTCGATCEALTGCSVLSNPATGHDYMFCKDNEIIKSWAAARDFCQGYGGDLAAVEDSAENDWIIGNLTTGVWWHGYNDIEVDNVWVWSHGSQKGFEYWDPMGEPDLDSPQDCALYTDIWLSKDFHWCDIVCDELHKFICEDGFALNPNSADTDGDGMPDGWEVTNGLAPNADDSRVDQDQDGLTNLEEYQGMTDPTVPDYQDTDGDGLTDYEERSIYGTSPVLADTDGDGFSDYTEVVEYGFNPAINPVKFNPLVADMPRFRVRVTSPPTITLKLTDTQGTSKSWTESISQERSSSMTRTDTYGVSVTAEVGVEAGLFGGVSCKVSATASYERSHQTTMEQKFAFSESESFEQSSEIASSGGILMVTVEVENNGNFAFRVDNLILSAFIPDFSSPQERIFEPVGNLIPDTDQYKSFPVFTLGPGYSFGPINFINDTLDLATARNLLLDPSRMSIAPAIYELTDPTGKSFAFNLTDVNARTANIKIDFAGRQGLEEYNVATNADPDSPGLTLGQALTDVLLIPFDGGTVTWLGGETIHGLDWIRSETVNAKPEFNGHWIVVHIRSNGLTRVTMVYDFTEAPYDFEGIMLQPGDEVVLAYVEDKDQDGIYSREELMRGTCDYSSDSDGDGLTDDVEISEGTNPANRDTDFDNLGDFIDPDPLVPNQVNVSAGADFTLLVKADGSLWAWGENDLGQLGLGSGDTADKTYPTLAPGATDWVQVSAGNTHGAGLKKDGSIETWGSNSLGQLGVDYVTGHTTGHVTVAPAGGWTRVSAGVDHTHAIMINGNHWAWGDNTDYRLGIDAPVASVFSPNMAGSYNDIWKDLEAGGNFNLAVKKDGSLWSAGGNDFGQLGLMEDATYDAIAPEQIGSETDWARVSAARLGYHGLALKKNFMLYAWGSNDRGQLGNGTTSNRNAPMPVGISYLQVSAGGEHSLGIKTDGTLWAWGDHSDGQLGLGDQVVDYTSVPKQVGNEPTWMQASAGKTHSAAIKADGTVWEWGKGQPVPVCITSVIEGATCPPTSDVWTWMGGSNSAYSAGWYGDKGVPSRANYPGARERAVSWTDNNGNFWLFGGVIDCNPDGNYDLYPFVYPCASNDLWKFDGSNWTWMSGRNLPGEESVYGTKYVEGPANVPGNRASAASWTDNSGNLWLYGGYGIGSDGELTDYFQQYYDLWKYNINTGKWIWWGGYDEVELNAVYENKYQRKADYGTQGVPSSSNWPGWRVEAATWTDNSGNLWLFGGSVWPYDWGWYFPRSGDYSDLWKYDISAKQWTWMKGSDLARQYGTYGTMGVPDPANVPGARRNAISWTDDNNDLWLFGGFVFYDEGTFGVAGGLNDLWKYDISSNQWTWMDGSTTIGQTPNYSSPPYYPGARDGSVSWKDSAGVLWLSGGYGKDAGGAYTHLNDLWKYDVNTGEWTWIDEHSSAYSFGIKYTPDAGNKPPGHRYSVSWIDEYDNLWMLRGRDGNGLRNDLWRYEP